MSIIQFRHPTCRTMILIHVSAFPCIFIILAYFSVGCQGFNVFPSTKSGSPRHLTYLRQAKSSESPTNQTASFFPLLPPSLDIGPLDKDQGTLTLGGDSQPVAFVAQAKFELQYTCNICETRNSHQVSRMAYRKGVVIAVCKGCKSKHMIADNLGWTNYKGGFEGSNNIEEYMESKGRGENINRVSTDVFSLEKSLHLQSPPETGVQEGFS